MNTTNTNLIKSLWRWTVMSVGVVACVTLVAFAMLFLFKNHILLGPLDSVAGSPGVNWTPDMKGEGSATVDFNDPATKGGYDFVLSNTASNTVDGPANNAECRCPLFPLGPAAGGARPITFSFAYKLTGVVDAKNDMRIQLRFWSANGNQFEFINERVVYVGTQTGDSEMTGYRTVTINGIKAPQQARMADVWANANIFEPWVSGTGRFANISVTTTRSLPFRILVAVVVLAAVYSLLLLLNLFWRRSAH
jgi:hypothetical protein